MDSDKKRMWSPWRSQHLSQFVKQHQPSDGQKSLFARMAAEDRDEENLILWRGSHVFVVMNLYPYNNGHVLIVPYRQVSDYLELNTDEKLEIMNATDRALRWLGEAFSPDGYNIGMNIGESAGAGIPEHLHMHVVPRWHGDTNFMPTVADVKVIPEAMRDTFEKLRAVVRSEQDP